MWLTIFEPAQAHLRQALSHQRFENGPCYSKLTRPEGYVFENGRRNKLIVGILKEQADTLAHGIQVFGMDWLTGDPAWCGGTCANGPRGRLGMCLQDRPLPLVDHDTLNDLLHDDHPSEESVRSDSPAVAGVNTRRDKLF